MRPTLFVLLSLVASAQEGPKFEVATIKPSAAEAGPRFVRVEPGGVSGDDVDELRRPGRELPRRFVEPAIDGDRPRGAVAGVACGLDRGEV